jgi:hypothetical protein
MVQFAYLVALLGFSVTTKNFAKIVARPGNRIPRTVAIRRVKV